MGSNPILSTSSLKCQSGGMVDTADLIRGENLLIKSGEDNIGTLIGSNPISSAILWSEGTVRVRLPPLVQKQILFFEIIN